MLDKLADGIFSVGYVDWTVRDFHGYRTEHGSTYNSYLILDEKNTLIDTVKAPYVETFLEHISACCSPEEISYIVCNHAEPDHSSALPGVMAACKNAVLVCNAKCRDALSKHFDVSGWDIKVVSEGEVLSIGKRNIKFFNKKMVH